MVVDFEGHSVKVRVGEKKSSSAHPTDEGAPTRRRSHTKRVRRERWRVKRRGTSSGTCTVSTVVTGGPMRQAFGGRESAKGCIGV